jgi:Tfp pilus assembly protein PilN
MSAVSGIRSLGSINITLGKPGSKNTADSLVVGGVPRVHLLPPEIEVQKRARSQRQGLLAALVVVIASVVVGFGVATFALIGANASLATEQARATAYVAASNEYSPVLKVQRQMSDITAAQPLAASGEISWLPFLSSVKGTLPPGMTVTDFEARLDTAAEQDAVATTPLAAPHVATLDITTTTSTMPISDWLDRLKTVKGYVDATPGSVNLDQTTGIYTVQVQLHVNAKAESKRFQEAK